MMDLPQVPRLERILLASLVKHPDRWADLNQLVKPSDMGDDANRQLYELLEDMVSNDVPIDLVTVTGRLQGKDTEQLLCLVSDYSDTPPASSLRYYARQIRTVAAARDLYLGARQSVQDLGKHPAEQIDAALETIRETLDIAAGRLRRGETNGPEQVTEYLPRLLAEMESRPTAPDRRVWSGFKSLDLLLEGWQPGHLVLLASRPAMGKSSLALNIADHNASAGVPTMFISLEMTRAELTTRLLAARSPLTLSELRNRNLTPEQWEHIEETSERLHITALPLFIEDRPALILSELMVEVKRLVDTAGVRLVVIDYIQLIRLGGRQQDRYQEVTEVSRALKIAAMEMGITIVALAQLNRGLEARRDKRPGLADLRESGSLEQDADSVMMLYRDSIYNDTTPEVEAEIIIRKNRHGRTGTAHLDWHGSHTLFTEPTEDRFNA